jgi:hypothetical protein
MATTATTTPNQPVTYTLLVIFTVDPRTGERLQDQQAIRERRTAGSRVSTLQFTASTFRKAD